jgi:hypothetical protein
LQEDKGIGRGMGARAREDGHGQAESAAVGHGAILGHDDEATAHILARDDTGAERESAGCRHETGRGRLYPRGQAPRAYAGAHENSHEDDSSDPGH